MFEITESELALILEALDDAAFYRDTRSRVLKSAVNKRNRRSSSSENQLTNATNQEAAGADIHRGKAQAYEALGIKLRRGR
ncbi:MAG TPA: hypothetical protein VGK42_07625 [Candidatus Dormibacteraeota bacterium]|jgi:hypothetical protein